MKLLLIGANGQVGREILDVVSQSDNKQIELIAFDRSQVDITNMELVTKKIGSILPHIVINAAAYTAVDQAENESNIAYAINRDAVGNIAKACASYNIPLIHISTDYVFDGEKKESYTEEDPVNPRCAYGKSKWEGEEAVRENLQQHIILRTSWVFGAYGKNFVYTIIRLARQNDELRIVNDQHGCPTYANSIAKAIVELCDKLVNERNESWGTYHYCGQPSTTWYEFAKYIIERGKDALEYKAETVTPICTQEFPTPAKRPQNSALNCDKIRATFGIEQADWREDLQEMFSHKHFKQTVQ